MKLSIALKSLATQGLGRRRFYSEGNRRLSFSKHSVVEGYRGYCMFLNKSFRMGGKSLFIMAMMSTQSTFGETAGYVAEVLAFGVIFPWMVGIRVP